jgi:hypothetical protein
MIARRRRRQVVDLLLATSASGMAQASVKFTINVLDAKGTGFNDTTPATPVGGNTGTTVGQQRLIVFQAAADAWGRVLESSVPIERCRRCRRGRRWWNRWQWHGHGRQWRIEQWRWQRG